MKSPRKVLQALLKNRRRLAVFLVVVGIISGGLTLGSIEALQYMETPEFCGRCHTMKPQLRAYEQSPHRSIECAECHVGRGLKNLVRSKMDGTVQLVRLVTNTHEQPILPAGHKMLKGAENCRRCHGDPPSNQDRLVLRRHFDEDEKNTEQLVALLVRLAQVEGDRGRGIHWHVRSKVEYLAGDESEQRVDYVRVTEPTGEVKEYVSADLKKQWESSESLLAPVDASKEHLKRMDCISCHNRVGHEFLPPGQAIDQAMATGKLDKDLPYMKKKGVELLTSNYASTEAAFAAIGELGEYYQQAYPSVYEQKRQAIDKAIGEMRELYGRVASPEMQATYQLYPSFLGHRDKPGCFRCHDSGHYLVENSRPTTTTIPFYCSLCHSFPQRGGSVRTLMLGAPPDTHRARLWVVNHRQEAGSPDVTRTICSNCHSQSYCTNCHALGISHTNMLFDHAAVAREKGAGTCTYCHQRPLCARCHENEVLPAAR